MFSCWASPRSGEGYCRKGDCHLLEPFELADIKAGLRDGGKILGVFIVARPDSDEGPVFVVYFRTDWTQSRTFRILSRFRTEGVRTYKNLGSLYKTIRSIGYDGRITIYPSGDNALHTFVGVLPEDLGDHPADMVTSEGDKE